MKCQSFEEIVSELARDRNSDQIEPRLRERAMVHLEECAECELRLQDERALTRRLQEMAREMKSLTASDRVEGQLLEAFRQRQRSEVRDQRSEIRGRRSEIRGRWNRWVVATAAVVLIALGIAGLRRYEGRQSQPGTPENAVAKSFSKGSPSTVDVRATNSPLKPEKQLPEQVVKRTHTQPRPRLVNRDSNTNRQVLATTTALANDNDGEVATQFMPLGYAGPINPQDGGQLVRVELSRSAMLSMGLPVNMDRYGERVKADVLLGADGLARAIRFVQ
jgi:hypothetical protein